MQRTISAMVGDGSVNHNSRKFKAVNVDGERTHLNVDYCNGNIKNVYHKLFDEALKKYNDKQTRSDRKIKNYYDKICNSKQEKPFHEIILQIGNKEDMGAESENGQLAKQVLDEYFRGFQERNPQLRVFSAHLHMDEATPHIHIDFVPFTTGSKRGLETRVSPKQALAAQGFKGGTRSDTEWNQWVQSEKEQLAEKKDEFVSVQNRIQNYDNGTKVITELEQRIENDSEYQLPDPPALMSAKSYKMKLVEPLIKKLKAVIKEVFFRYYKARDDYNRLNVTNGTLYRDNEKLTKINAKLTGENENLRAENRDYKLLRKVFGSKQIDNLLEQAREKQQSNQREKRFRNTKYER